MDWMDWMDGKLPIDAKMVCGSSSSSRNAVFLKVETYRILQIRRREKQGGGVKGKHVKDCEGRARREEKTP